MVMGELSLQTLYGDIAMDLLWHVYDFSVEYKPFDSDSKVHHPEPTIHIIQRVWSLSVLSGISTADRAML